VRNKTQITVNIYIMDTPDEEAINSGVAALGLTNSGSDRSMTDLLQRSRTMIAELDEFRTYLKNQKKDKGVELRHFGSCLQSEFKSLEKVPVFATPPTTNDLPG
jgi:hypothetical protein